MEKTTIKLRPLGRSSLDVAPICLGGNVFGWTIDEQMSFRLLDAWVDAGMNFVDTADVYSRWVPGHAGGESETIIGKWLKQSGKRDRIILATKVGTAEADLVIGCDPIVAANKATLAVMREGRTYVALNTHATPTAAFVADPDWQFPSANCEAAVAAAAGPDHIGKLDADVLAVQLLGDSIYTNPLLLGYAWQQGRVPLSHAALMRAIELNAVQVDNNKTAFEWGRRAVSDPNGVRALVKTGQVIELVKRSVNLEDMIAKRVEFLTGYQNAAYAARYKAFVDKVRSAEAEVAFSRSMTRPDASRPSTKLTEAVARYLFKLMAYKDEYEVARLHADPKFLAKVAGQFEGEMGKDYQLAYHLAPPAIAKKNAKGELQKQRFGPWMLTAFRVLARLKGLRGTPLDPFGRTDERREERALVQEYRDSIEEVLRALGPANGGLAAEIARVPEMIRGYGHVKARHLAAARPKWDALMAEWRAGPLALAAQARQLGYHVTLAAPASDLTNTPDADALIDGFALGRLR